MREPNLGDRNSRISGVYVGFLGGGRGDLGTRELGV